MNSFNISKRKYEHLRKYELPDEVMSTEANFYKLNYLGNTMIFKSLFKTKGTIFANKLFTLEMLNEYKEMLPNNFVIPTSLVTVDKEIKGFVLPFIKGYNLECFLENKKIHTQDKLYYIKKVGEILSKLHRIRQETSLDCIYINDLHASNFIIEPENKELKVVDLDSCRICDSKPFPARYLTPLSLLNKAPGDNKYDIYKKDILSDDGFPILEIMSQEEYESSYCKYKNYKDELGFVNSNEDSDLYCYTILFLNFLYGSNVGCMSLEKFYNYMNYLEYLKFDQNLINAFIKIVISAPNENIEDYVEKVTPEQVARAKRYVYEASTKIKR